MGNLNSAIDKLARSSDISENLLFEIAEQEENIPRSRKAIKLFKLSLPSVFDVFQYGFAALLIANRYAPTKTREQNYKRLRQYLELCHQSLLKKLDEEKEDD